MAARNPIHAAPPARPIVTRFATIQVSRATPASLLTDLFDRTNSLSKGRSHLVVTPNMHHLAMLERSATLAAAYDEASLHLADGWPVVRLANALGGDVGGRVTGSELVTSLADSNGNGRTVFLVGGSTSSSVIAAGERFERNGWVAYTNQAPAGWIDDADNLADLAAAVDASGADLVIVGLGTPKQELVAQRLRGGTTTAVFLCVGAGIDFVSGEKRRAPDWMQRVGLEWLHRIVTEPGRLLGRYIEDVPPFLRVVRQSFRAPASLETAGRIA